MGWDFFLKIINVIISISFLVFFSFNFLFFVAAVFARMKAFFLGLVGSKVARPKKFHGPRESNKLVSLFLFAFLFCVLAIVCT
ncbi:hypothetical protein QBC44DRAFT_336236 [Cladorrhinum sp. PSN332]|nr:hypothetical protein QBC44DRAFT_336236 [Cladorrhinum sp. PSN332]